MKEEKKQHVHADVVPLKAQKTALLVGTYRSAGDKLLCLDYLDELMRLCDTYGLEVKDKVPCSIKKIDAALFLGKGKLEEISKMASELEADVIIFDDEITPHQQRNLEKFLLRPV